MKRPALALVVIFFGVLATCTVSAQTKTAAKSDGTASQGANYSVRNLPLPDNNTGDVSMDYITYDPATNSVWVPGGNIGAVDVVDVATSKVRQIPGFTTREVAGRGGDRKS